MTHILPREGAMRFQQTRRWGALPGAGTAQGVGGVSGNSEQPEERDSRPAAWRVNWGKLEGVSDGPGKAVRTWDCTPRRGQ